MVLLRARLPLYTRVARAIHCRGHGTCGTCAVRVEGPVSEPTAAELRRLRFPPHQPEAGLRLACQMHRAGRLTVTKYEGLFGQHTDSPSEPSAGSLAALGYPTSPRLPGNRRGPWAPRRRRARRAPASRRGSGCAPSRARRARSSRATSRSTSSVSMSRWTARSAFATRWSSTYGPALAADPAAQRHVARPLLRNRLLPERLGSRTPRRARNRRRRSRSPRSSEPAAMHGVLQHAGCARRPGPQPARPRPAL